MSYHHLSACERKVIARMYSNDHSNAEIARVLGRDASTIGRELARNTCKDGVYRPKTASLIARSRRKNVQIVPTLERCPKLLERVKDGLKRYWSPEQISGRMKHDGIAQRVSHQTIYRYIAKDRDANGELFTYLRHNNRKWRTYRPRGYKTGLGRLSGYRPIEERPQAVDTQERFGDWEGDTVRISKTRRTLATYVERQTCYLMSKVLENRTAPVLTTATRKMFRSLPAGARKTITVDHGKEFAHFKELESGTSAKVYFARPYCSTDKPIVENINGLIRQFLPKRQSFDTLSQRELNKYITLINNRPRKKLGYRTPNEVFKEKTIALGT